MVKVVWLFPPSDEGGFPNISQYRFYKKMPIRVSIIYPYLASMGATLLKKHGYGIEFLDCPTMDLSWQDVFDELDNADFVVLEARTPLMPNIWKLCKELRYSYPSLKIILYGDHVTWNPKESLPYCDHIVMGGNFDYGVYQLVDLLTNGYDMKEIFHNKPFSLDSLPFVDRKLVPWERYYEAWRHRDKFFWTMSMRGCFYKCIFCAWTKTFWNNRIVCRSIFDVASEFEYLYNEYGKCEVLDDADCFSIDWGKVFAQELIDRGLSHREVLWAIQTHPNEINNLDTLKLLKRSGLETVKLGVESLNDFSLKKMKKLTNFKQIKKSFELLKEADIQIHANLMVGFPWENKKEAYKTIELIKDLDPNQAQFSLVIPYPNTELFDLAKENDWLLVKEGDWGSYDASKPMLKMEGLSSEEIIQLYKDNWSKFYLNRKYIWNHLKKVKHWEGIKQLFRGFRSIYFGHMRAVEG